MKGDFLMKYLSKNLGIMLGILLLGGLVFWLTQTLTSPPSDAPSPFTLQSPIIFQSPVLPPIPSPTATPISIVNNASSPISPPDAPPPPCQFEAEPSTVLPESESLLERYVFSEPRPALDYIAGLEIIQWLPDDQRLLISRIGDGRRIEVFNTQTGKIKEYANGGINGLGKVVWLEQEQAVAYTDYGETGKYSLNLANERGIVSRVSGDLASPFIAIKPNGQASFVSSGQPGKPQLFNPATEIAEGMPFREFELPETDSENYPFQTYKMVWNPNGKQLAYYNEQVFYLVNIQTGDVCELDLDLFSTGKIPATIAKTDSRLARWSPDGRYLALFVAPDIFPAAFIDLAIIDVLTGEYKILNTGQDDDEYKHTMAWASNSRDILLVSQKATEETLHNVYVVDVVSGDARQLFSDRAFFFSGYSGVAWSSNAKTIAIDCPSFSSNAPNQLCLIEVMVK
jgi:Tol biopolymer transport system component